MKTKRNAPGRRRGKRASEMAIPKVWRKHFSRLLKLRAKVLEDTVELSSEACEAIPAFSMHPAEAASDSFDRDLALSLLALEQNALGEIDAALQRIRDGRYGVCEVTGMFIPRARLEAPWARCTTQAQAELEKNGDETRACLNPRHSVRRTEEPG